MKITEVKHYCDVCHREMDIHNDDEYEDSGSRYIIKQKKYNFFSGWDYEKIDICNDCKKSFYTLWKRYRDE